MKTITKTVHLVAYHFDFMDAGEVNYGISAHGPGSGSSVIGSWPHEITLPLPEEFNVHAAQVAALEAVNRISTIEKRDTLADTLDPKWTGPLPYTILIAPGGEVVYRKEGPIESLRGALEWVLPEEPPCRTRRPAPSPPR